jgi:hypothetical protein
LRLRRWRLRAARQDCPENQGISRSAAPPNRFNT